VEVFVSTAVDVELDKILGDAFKEAGFSEADVWADKGFISTGNLAFDYVLGGQGLPCGRSAEFYGLSQSGKTTAACEVAVQAQKQGKLVVYFDYEQALDKPYLQAMGVNITDRSLFRAFPPGSLEHGCEVAVDLARTGRVGLMIFDSVPAMVPRSSAEEDKDSRTLAMERARLLGNFLSKLNPILARTGTTAIFINHIRDVIETGPTRPGMPKRTTTPGGSALKFYTSIRVKFAVTKNFKSERSDPLTGEVISVPHSVLTRVEVTKNKVAAPYQFASLYLELGTGFSQGYSAVQALLGNKVIKKNGAFFYFPEGLYHPSMTQSPKGASVQGLQNVLNLASDPEWCAKLAAWAIKSLPATRVLVSLPDLEEGGEEPVPTGDEALLAEEELPVDVVPVAAAQPSSQPVARPALARGPGPGDKVVSFVTGPGPR
jgi:recombination protein RecA